jgi:phosphate starvation-inducible PhoH-like protein
MAPKKTHVTAPKPLTAKQAQLARSISEKEMTIVTGPAGTGKTFMPAALAAYYYSKGLVETIIITRPTVPCGKGLGFLPGTIDEKIEPWVAPIIQVLIDFLSKGEVECMVKNGKLKIIPFDTIRGHTFNSAFVILDEAQNTTIPEIKAFVTRTGKDSRTVINGDISQSDLKNNEKSGLAYLTYLLEDVNNENLSNKVGQVHFEIEDCVRSAICKAWIKAFDDDNSV